jgi:hypothetical protein
VNIELWPSYSGYEVIASLELPTLPVRGQRIDLMQNKPPEQRYYEVVDAYWSPLDENHRNIQGYCVVKPIEKPQDSI